jgi:hypothetical protein
VAANAARRKAAKRSNCTNGCAEIEQIYRAVPDGTPIEIVTVGLPGGVRLALPCIGGARPGDPAVFGVRPEHLRLDKPGDAELAATTRPSR